MKRAWMNGLGALLVLVAGLGAVFVFSTVAADEMPDAITAGAPLFAALVLTLLFGGMPRVERIRSADRRQVTFAVAGGIAAWWLAPLIVLAQRLSDAPPGAEVVFFTLAVWGACLVLVALAIRAEKPPLTAAAAAVASVAGSATLLASWERPSSFSPFIRYAEREIWMVVAGVVFALGMLALVRAVRALGVREAAPLALSGAAAAGLLGMLGSVGELRFMAAQQWLSLLYLGIAIAIAFGAWMRLLSAVGASRAATGMLVAPVGLTLLTVVERLTGIYGPDPFEWTGIVAGSAVVVASSVVVWLAVPATRLGSSHLEPVPGRLRMGLASAAFVASLASLASPGVQATSEGHATTPFSATWIMVGAETATGWLVFSAALLVLAVVAERASAARASRIAALVAAVTSGIAAVLAAATPLHTWTTWIPADVQQTYGTEYARFVTEALVDPVRIVALVLTAAALVSAVPMLVRPASQATEEVD